MGTYRNIIIHNVYNPSPSFYSIQEKETFTSLRNALLTSADDHIITGDFNLHHPMWYDISRPTQYVIIDILIDICRNSSLALITPHESVTWTTRNTYSTIDLLFVSQRLINKTIKCLTRWDLVQSLDHIPIETTFCFQTQ